MISSFLPPEQNAQRIPGDQKSEKPSDHPPTRKVSADKPSLAGLSFTEITAQLTEKGLVSEKQARMRTQQLWRWIYFYGYKKFSDMSNMSLALRTQLEETFTLERPEIVTKEISEDGVRKYLIRFTKGVEAETVFIPAVSKTGALCVSSQVGCTLNCRFCHTGTQKLVRNLTAAEIVAQVMIVRDDLGEWPSTLANRKLTNIVFMGMGEPLYNFENIVQAIDIISDGEGLSIGRRRITVSTSGVVPKIQDLGLQTRTMLAISLHAVTNELRNQLVPINKKYPIEMLLEACRQYPGVSNSKRITFEYVMLKGINDQTSEAKALVQLLAGIPAKINLIPFNPWPGSGYECSDWEQIEAFASVLNASGYAAPIRTPRGRDILAACGQLRSESLKQRASLKFRPRERTELYQEE